MGQRRCHCKFSRLQTRSSVLPSICDPEGSACDLEPCITVLPTAGSPDREHLRPGATQVGFQSPHCPRYQAAAATPASGRLHFWGAVMGSGGWHLCPVSSSRAAWEMLMVQCVGSDHWSLCRIATAHDPAFTWLCLGLHVGGR